MDRRENAEAAGKARLSLGSNEDRHNRDVDLLELSSASNRRRNRGGTNPGRDDILVLSDDELGSAMPSIDDETPLSQPEDILNRQETSLESQPIVFLGRERSDGSENAPLSQPPSRQASASMLHQPPDDEPYAFNQNSFRATDPLDRMLMTQASLDASLMMVDTDQPSLEGEDRGGEGTDSNRMEIAEATQLPADDLMMVDLVPPSQVVGPARIAPSPSLQLVPSQSASSSDPLLNLAAEALASSPSPAPNLAPAPVPVRANAVANDDDSSMSRRLPLWMVAEKDHQEELQQRFHEKTTRSRLGRKHTQRMAEVPDSEVPEAPLATGPVPISASKIWLEETAPEGIGAGRVICFDVETTGFSSRDVIIEIGAVELIGGFRTGVMYQSYIKPKVPVNPFASAVHGLTNERLEKAPPVELVLPAFLAWIGTSPLVAHNAAFDMRMLVQECERQGLEAFLQNRPVFCTMKAHRALFPGRPYALIDVYLSLRDKQDVQTVRFCLRRAAHRLG